MTSSPTPTLRAAPDPAPGAWIDQAQAALDQLGRCDTVEDVVRSTGSARQLAVTILGYPTSGGHATKPVIRALGELLQHRSGPGVAVAPLALASAVYELVDTATVEALLRAAAQTAVVFRPPDLREVRVWLGDELIALPRRSREDRLRDHLIPQITDPPTSRWADRPSAESPADDLHLPSTGSEHRDDLESWHAWHMGWRTGDPTSTPRRGVKAARRLRRWTAEELLWDDDLLDLPPEVLGILIRRNVDAALSSPQLPPLLADHVQFPYDLGTIELALRAPTLAVDRPTLRRRLGEIDGPALHTLADRAAPHLAAALAGLGLLDRLREVLRDGTPAAARAMALAIPAADLVPEDAPFLERLAPQRLAACPGARPMILPRPNAEVERPAAPGRRLPTPYRYATEVRELAGAIEDLGWQVHLPRDRADLLANAELMRNCTAGYASAIRQGRTAILRLTRSTGEPFNVELYRYGGRWWIGQIAGRHNGHTGVNEVASVIREAIRLAAPAEEPARPLRRRKLRRRPGGGVRTPWDELRPSGERLRLDRARPDRARRRLNGTRT